MASPEKKSKSQAGLRKILSQKVFVEQGEPVDDERPDNEER